MGWVKLKAIIKKELLWDYPKLDYNNIYKRKMDVFYMADEEIPTRVFVRCFGDCGAKTDHYYSRTLNGSHLYVCGGGCGTSRDVAPGLMMRQSAYDLVDDVSAALMV